VGDHQPTYFTNLKRKTLVRAKFGQRVLANYGSNHIFNFYTITISVNLIFQNIKPKSVTILLEGDLIELGEAVGIIVGQSIGEP